MKALSQIEKRIKDIEKDIISLNKEIGMVGSFSPFGLKLYSKILQLEQEIKILKWVIE